MSGKRFFNTVLIILAISFTFSDCKKKDEKVTVSGTAINPQTGYTVAGMQVTLSAKTITSGTWNSLFSTIQTQTTSADGSFSMEFDNIRASEFKLTFYKTGYFLDEYIFSPDLINPGKEYNNNYAVHFEAWIKLFFKNYPPTSPSDMISYRFLKGSASCPEGCNDSLSYLSGANIDTYHICKLYGSQNAVIEWNYSSNYSNLQHIDTVWIAPNDTAIHYINF